MNFTGIKYPPKPMRGWAGTDLHKRLIADPDWIVEPKKNGERCIVHMNGAITLWTRRCKRITASPTLVEALRSMLSDSRVTILDGELVHKDMLWLFDVPEMHHALDDRRAILLETCKAGCDMVKVVPWLDKNDAYETCIRAGEEGVVFKQLSSVYRPQPEPDNEVPFWVKIKPPEKW